MRTNLKKAKNILPLLKIAYPRAKCALTHRNAWELLVATILSAQCTDFRVNTVTPALFQQYKTPRAMAEADIKDLERLVRTTGFYRNKAKSIKGASQLITSKFKDKVPNTMEELLELPGVARKTANVVLGTWYHQNDGVVVDTHVKRLSNRLGLTTQQNPGKIERELMKLFPKKEWTNLSHMLILHGRKLCTARRPKCDECPLNRVCPSAFRFKK